MKTKFIKVLSVVLVSFLLTSCEKFVEGVSEFDPTQPVDASLAQVINSAEVAYIGYMEGDLARLSGMFVGQFTGVDRQYASLNNYVVTPADFDNAWGNIYAGVLKSLRIAQTKATAANNKRALALAQILEAHTMGMTAAMFGDIPYSNAIDVTGHPNPEFDSQTDVYTAVLALLNSAITNINTAAAGTAYEGDIFGGNDAAWKRRANTLIAKFNLHLGNYTAAATAAQLGIVGLSDEIMAPHGGIYQSNFNIYYSFLTYDRPGYMTADGALAPKLLDPGLATFPPGDPFVYKNIPYRGNSKTDETARFLWYYQDSGLNANVLHYDINVLWAPDWGSPVGNDGAFGAETPFPILSVGENQLILAECLLRTGNPDGAIAALNTWRGILDGGYRIGPGWLPAGSGYADYVTADFQTGGMENPDNIATNDAIYREIIQEKYISLIGNLEAFNDARRLGFGTFANKQNWETLGIVPSTGNEIPQRFLVAQVEITSNTSVPNDLPGLFDKTSVFE